MSTNMDILKTMLLTWTDEEINEAWRLIAKEGNMRRDRATTHARSHFRAGDKVFFEGNRSGACHGTIVRVKRKKAIVQVGGRNWDVPLNLLKKVA
tara:strand:- start:202 stop:486 length:285 start_codon:yes stop_codon:yes gene_type:complete